MINNSKSERNIEECKTEVSEGTKRWIDDSYLKKNPFVVKSGTPKGN